MTDNHQDFLSKLTKLCLDVMFYAGLFSLVLAQVFAQAVSYKLENDFTI